MGRDTPGRTHGALTGRRDEPRATLPRMTRRERDRIIAAASQKPRPRSRG
jgi:hypothetical protein